MGGRSGDLFNGVLEDGARVVVKKVDFRAGLDCTSELEFYSKVSHPRLVPLVGHCLDNLNATFLIYKHMSNGDLESSLLQGIASKDGKGFKPLDWTTRLKIATGAAEALCYLHHECVPPLVHRYIQASSILLDDNFEVRLGSFSSLCIQQIQSKSNRSRITRFLLLPKGFKQGASGASDATCAYDVHCFGKVLLELVTGNLLLSAAMLSYTNINDIGLVKSIVDPLLILDGDQSKEAWAIAIIAKACLNPQPSRRPLMRYVYLALQNPVSVVMAEDRSNWARLATTSHTRSTLPGYDGSIDIPSKSPVPEPYKQGVNSINMIRDGKDLRNSSDKVSSASIPSTPKCEDEVLQSPNLKSFSFSDLKMATGNFHPDRLLGEGGFGQVFKGWIDENSSKAAKTGTGIVIAVKRLTPESFQGHKEWLAAVKYLGQFSHPHIVKLIGYCLEKENRLLVYEFMPRGSFNNHLFRRVPYSPLSWNLRLKVALGAAKGLAFLHSAETNVIYRNFKTSNILLDSNYNPKLCGFGLARDGPKGDESHVSTAVMGTFEYAAPEYMATGHLTAKSDVYSFGVVLLEMLSGRRAFDPNRPSGEQNLADWAKPYLINKRKFFRILDSRLEGQYTFSVIHKTANLAARCISIDPRFRPTMDEIVKELEEIQATRNAENISSNVSNSSRP